ncbi:hypothetical protein niasHS_004869 [Heterodera schachtii]|uniref:Uncharacterized protein n=1 Tax=Heterodera schachtii TaxID=97005 RepID=A0ABD2JLV0_HETSC
MIQPDIPKELLRMDDNEIQTMVIQIQHNWAITVNLNKETKGPYFFRIHENSKLSAFPRLGGIVIITKSEESNEPTSTCETLSNNPEFEDNTSSDCLNDPFEREDVTVFATQQCEITDAIQTIDVGIDVYGDIEVLQRFYPHQIKSGLNHDLFGYDSWINITGFWINISDNFTIASEGKNLFYAKPMDHQNSLIHNQQHYIGTCIETVIRMYSREWDPVEEANREWFRSLQLGPPNSDRETSSRHPR